MSRINIVREIKQKNKLNSKERKREQGWNDRFFLGKIPDYKANNIMSNPIEELKQMRQTTSKSNRSNMNPLSTRYTPCKSALNHNYNNYDSNISNSTKTTIANKAYNTNSNSNSNSNSNYNGNDPYMQILSMWDELGVRIPYRKIYESIASQLANQIQNDFYDLELNSLRKFNECLMKNAQEITNREKSIFLLQKLDQVLGNNLRDEDCNINDSKIITDIIQTIKNIRVYSINVVFQMNKIRELCSYSTVSGKFDLDKLSKSFLFNRNYLIKMRSDLDFLYQSNLSFMFNFAESSDPFLQACSFESGNDKRIITVPIDEEIGQAMHQSQYIIMQDLIYYQMQVMEQQQQLQQGDDRDADPIDRIIKDESGKGKGVKAYSSANSAKRPAKIERECIPSVSKDELMRRMEEYDQLQKNLEMDREIIGKRKEDLNKERNNEQKKEIANDDDDNDNETEDHEEMGRINVRDIKEEAYKNDKKSSHHEENKDNEEEEDEDINIDWNAIDNSNKKKTTTEEVEHKAIKENDDKEKDKEEENIEEDIKQENHNIQEQQQRIEEEITQNLNIYEEEKKLDTICNNNHSITQSSQQNKIIATPLKSTTSKINQTPRRYDSPQFSPTHIINASLRRSMTPKTHASHLQKSFKMAYFTGTLPDFLPLYSTYHPSIPQDQLIIFHIQSNPLQTILSAYSPKILLCTSSTTKDIKGLCIFSFDNENETVIKVNILHLSSIKQNEEIILQELIEHIKRSVYCNEISIDLYYKFADGKFVINKELRDLFKDSLGFRWSKLENLAQHVRYQKMYLKTMLDGSCKDDYMRIVPLNTMRIKTASVITVTKDKEEDNDRKEYGYEKYMNLFSVVYLLNWVRINEAYTLSGLEGEGDENKKKLTWAITHRDNVENNLKCYYDSYMNINQMLSDNDFNSLFPQRQMNDSTKCSYLSNILQLKPSFSSGISGMIDNVYYNRIQGQIKKIKHNEYGQLFYLIPATDGNNSIVFAQINPRTKEDLIERNGNIYDLFNSYYNKLEPIDEKNDNEDNNTVVLWVPSFDIETHMLCKRIQSLNDVIIKKDDGELYINGIDEYLTISFGNNTIANTNENSSFVIQPTKDDIIIADTFLFGLVNLNMLSSFGCSTILLLNVTKDHWKTKKQ